MTYLKQIGSFVLAVGLCVGSASASLQQDEVPTMTTDDILRNPDSVTRVNADVAAEAKASELEAASKRKVSEGYALFSGPRQYSFERPAAWQPIELKSSPGELSLDGSFQDLATGAVVTAISAERNAQQQTVDITKDESVAALLGPMLNPGSKSAEIKILRQTKGAGDNGVQWLRIKAEGTGQTTDGKSVPTTYWVQMIQIDSRFALVAVGYPTAQPAAAEQAFHTVRTLEFDDVAGSTSSGAPKTESEAGQQSEIKKNRAGGMRRKP